MTMTRRVGQLYAHMRNVRGKRDVVGMPWRIAFFKEMLPSSGLIVELGCRYGSVLHTVSSNTRTCLGADIDVGALAVARQRGYAVVATDLNRRLPFRSRSVDAVILTEVLEHLPYPELTVAEVRRMLRADGALIGTVPYGTRLKNRLHFLAFGTIPEDPLHLHQFSPNVVRSLLDRHFETVDVRVGGGRYARVARVLAKSILFLGRMPRAD